MNIAIILASGRGERMIGYEELKCFIEVSRKPLFLFSVETFLKHTEIKKIILTVPKGYINHAKDAMDAKILANVDVIEGSDSRQASVYNALTYIAKKYGMNNNVLIHDGARPLISSSIILNHIKNLKKGYSSLTAIKNYDSLLKIENGILKNSTDRDVYLEQTPASSSLKTMLDAHNFALENKICANDDVLLLKNFNVDVHLINGNDQNFKVTVPEDLKKLERHLLQ